MTDYLEIYKKFNDIKDIKEYVDEVETLRYYYNSKQFEKMQEHICKLTTKYILETMMWNAVNSNMPITYEQAYYNAENFLRTQGAIIITTKVSDYALRLSLEERTLVDSLIKVGG